MDRDDLPLKPTNEIVLPSNNTELVLKGARWNEYYVSQDYYLSGRYATFVEYYSIILCDIFTGIEKQIIPKTPGNVERISTYVQLSDDRAFIVYEGPNKRGSLNPIYLSIIHIDFEKSRYDFVYVKLFECIRTYRHLIHSTLDSVMFVSVEGQFAQVGYKLNICKLNPLLSNIEHHRSIEISNDYFCFHIINRDIVFARIRHNHDLAIVNLMKIDENNQFVEIEKTAATLEAHYERGVSAIEYRSSRDNKLCWHGTKFFYFCTIYDADHNEYGSPSVSPFLWVFEMQTKTWSEIILDFHLKYRGYRFGVDSDGILSLIKYRRDESNEPYTANLTRIALKSPEKLLNLCWFEVSKSDNETKSRSNLVQHFFE